MQFHCFSLLGKLWYLHYKELVLKQNIKLKKDYKCTQVLVSEVHMENNENVWLEKIRCQLYSNFLCGSGFNFFSFIALSHIIVLALSNYGKNHLEDVVSLVQKRCK